MRLTLFWTFFYSTIGFVGLTLFNLVMLDHPIVRDEGLADNIFVNQQLTHIIGIAIFVFLIVHFYYEKHPQGIFSAKKEQIKEGNPDIPDKYFDDPRNISVDQHLNTIVSERTRVDIKKEEEEAPPPPPAAAAVVEKENDEG